MRFNFDMSSPSSPTKPLPPSLPLKESGPDAGTYESPPAFTFSSPSKLAPAFGGPGPHSYVPSNQNQHDQVSDETACKPNVLFGLWGKEPDRPSSEKDTTAAPATPMPQPALSFAIGRNLDSTKHTANRKGPRKSRGKSLGTRRQSSGIAPPSVMKIPSPQYEIPATPETSNLPPTPPRALYLPSPPARDLIRT
jgi:hypothetical protein